MDAIVRVFLLVDVAELVEPGDDVVAAVRDDEFCFGEGIGDQFHAACFEGIETCRGAGAHVQCIRHEPVGALEHPGIGEIEFVENGDDGLVTRAEFAEHAQRGFVVLLEVQIRDIEHVNQEVGDDYFLERGLESFDETVGEATDEADGVGDEELLIAAEDELARGRVECGEEFVGSEDVRASEAVEQGGFAGIGVADDGAGRDGDALAFGALHAALQHDAAEFGFEVRDAVAHGAAIILELGFTFTAQAALAALPRKVGPGAREAWQGILHPREGDLQGGLARVSAIGEDFQDDFLAVDHGKAGEFLPVALLRG